MVGGRPNQALYFIGYVGDEALYLDPHTTQKCGSVGDKTSPSEIELDETYHQKYAARINFKNMDPSLALVCTHTNSHTMQTAIFKLSINIYIRRLSAAIAKAYSTLIFCLLSLIFQCFLCRTKSEFNELCTRLQNDLLRTGSQPLFEITRTSQMPWRSRPDRSSSIQKDADESEDDFEFIV